MYFILLDISCSMSKRDLDWFFWEVIPIVNFTYIAFVFVVFTPKIFLLFVIDLPIEMTSKISPLPLPKILSRLVERSVIRVEDKFDRRWQSRFREKKNWHLLRGESFLSLLATRHDETRTRSSRSIILDRYIESCSS